MNEPTNDAAPRNVLDRLGLTCDGWRALSDAQRRDALAKVGVAPADTTAMLGALARVCLDDARRSPSPSPSPPRFPTWAKVVGAIAAGLVIAVATDDDDAA